MARILRSLFQRCMQAHSVQNFQILSKNAYFQCSRDYTKGQIIWKGLFEVLKFSSKTNEQIRHSSKNKFVGLFFMENWRIPKVLLESFDL